MLDNQNQPEGDRTAAESLAHMIANALVPGAYGEPVIEDWNGASFVVRGSESGHKYRVIVEDASETSALPLREALQETTKTLDEAAELLSVNAEEAWQADLHTLCVDSWRVGRDTLAADRSAAKNAI